MTRQYLIFNTPLNISKKDRSPTQQSCRPFSTYRLFRNPCRTFPSLDSFHQLRPITCTCSTFMVPHGGFFRLGRRGPTRTINRSIAELGPYALLGKLSHPRLESSSHGRWGSWEGTFVGILDDRHFEVFLGVLDLSGSVFCEMEKSKEFRRCRTGDCTHFGRVNCAVKVESYAVISGRP